MQPTSSRERVHFLLSTAFFQSDLSASGRPTLRVPHEVELCSARNVTLLDSSNEIVLDNAELFVTNIRIYLIAGSLTKKCVACELKHIDSVADCAGFLKRSKRLTVHLKEQLADSAFRLPSSESTISLKFWDEGKESCLDAIQRSLSKRSWEGIPSPSGDQKSPGTLLDAVGLTATTSSVANAGDERALKAGIGGIMRRQEKERAAVDGIAKEALGDMDALMQRAREVVAIVQRYAAYSASESDPTETASEVSAEAHEMETILQNIGIVSPVTKFSAGRRYHEELARQIADLLLSQDRLSKLGGMIALTDLYCLYNRARGTELVSPDDLLAAAERMESLRVGMRMRTFPSKVIVVESTSFDEAAVCSSIAQIASKNATRGIGASMVAQSLRISVMIAKEHLLLAEKRGLLCRDDTIHGLHYFPNRFNEFVLSLK